MPAQNGEQKRKSNNNNNNERTTKQSFIVSLTFMLRFTHEHATEDLPKAVDFCEIKRNYRLVCSIIDLSVQTPFQSIFAEYSGI